MSNPLVELSRYGQSIWLDNISRDMLNKGELKALIEEIALKGVTSNPSIFQKAISQGSSYDDQIMDLLIKNRNISAAEIYEELAVKDIQNAADILKPVYDNTKGVDGYVSLEVSPRLAYDTEATIEEARRLYKWVNRPNVMIKIPATKEGIPAISRAISEGINVNVTLIFSPAMYQEVVEAYIKGLEERQSLGLPVSNIASVASFFISRIDSLTDKLLDQKGHKELQGRAAIDNAKLVYRSAKQLFSSERFKKLEAEGARVQRLLWASTSTKNPAYPDVIYVEELIGPDTVNTLPPATLVAYKDHGKPEARIENNVDESAAGMKKIADAGIDFEEITNQLLSEGVKLFIDSFIDLINGVDGKKEEFLTLLPDIKLSPETAAKVNSRLEQWEKANVLDRILKTDPTVWKANKEDDVELSNRLGWLNLPEEMIEKADEISSFAEGVKELFDAVVVLGMGGSSLAPEVFFNSFGKREGYPVLYVCDSTHPDAVKQLREKIDIDRTLFITSSKSGGTTETMSFFYYFYNELSAVSDNPGANFIAVTDPGTSLEKLAAEKNFRRTFTSPENVGGRFSALTYFGLIPAALVGVDVKELLSRAAAMKKECLLPNLKHNPGMITGAVLGELALEGKDKLTFITSEKVSSFTAWIEQLVAESTGKEGKGILPVYGEDAADPASYGSDHVFVNITLKRDYDNFASVKKLSDAGFPVIDISLNDVYDLGKQYFLWEMATAAAGAVLNINPFNQPNVQLAKTLSNESMKSFTETGKLPEQKAAAEKDDIEVYGSVSSVEDAVSMLMKNKATGSYAAIMAFIAPDQETDDFLNTLKNKINEKYKLAVTTGYGPRFLHSTGQLHKGDAGKGLFIQITSSALHEVDVPGTGYSFNVLIGAQTQGDMKALINSGRNVIRFHIKGVTSEGLAKIISFI